MKKLTILLMVSAMSISILSGCGGNGTASATKGPTAANTTSPATTAAEPTTAEPTAAEPTAAAAAPSASVSGDVIFMSNRTDLTDQFTKMSADFHAKYPNATVEIQSNGDLSNTLRLMIGSNSLPDVFAWDTGVFQQGQNQLLPESLMPLDDLGYNADNFTSYDNQYVTYNGQHYGLYEGFTATGLLASKKTLQKCGITKYPTTLDELYADLDAIKAAGITPMASMLKSAWPLGTWDAVAYANGYKDWVSTELSSDAPYTVDSPYGKQYSFILNFVDKGCFEQDMMSSDWDVVRKQMDNYGILMLANYGITALEDANGPIPSDQVAFFPLPIDNSGKPVSLKAGSYLLGISKATKYPDAAKAFLKFLIEESGYSDLIGAIPAYKEIKTSDPALRAFMDLNPVFYDRSDVPSDLSTQEANIQNAGSVDYMAAVQSVMTKSKTIQEALDGLNQQWTAGRKSLGLK